ncbi:MAG: putative DNA binding domain-containing protein [Bacteroidales bacterium]|nr:putative DNA binding domain-containing protein [Bacteroidales bacterium]
MALPINIEDLLKKRKVEGSRIEFKKGWNPTDVYRSICAFANDFDNLGGGYILVGVEEKNGIAKRPVAGINVDAVDRILKQMVGFKNMLDPYYLPRTSVEEVDGKQILAIWVPSGVNRPYAVPSDVLAKAKQMKYYIRSGSSSIVAKGEALEELRDMANRVPFDDRPNPNITMSDISMVLLRDYLAKIGSKLEASLFTQPLNQTLEQMDLMDGPTENRMIKNVAAMMFCEHPEKFFKYTQIDIVTFPNGRTKDPNNFSETTIRGSVPQLINGALTYLKNNIIREFVVKQKDVPESIRYFNYPIQALEEIIVNSLYHRDYQLYEPIEISIEPDGIHILSFPGPDRTISNVAIKEGDRLISRRYRNRRLGDFLKEMDLTEGRSTGIPTVQDELQKNGSPRATIETNDERSFINVFVPIHEGCGDKVILNDPENILDTKDETIDVTKETENVTKDEAIDVTKVENQRITKNITKAKSKNVTKDGVVNVTKESKDVTKTENQGVINNVTKAKFEDVTNDWTVNVIKEPQYVTKELSERQEIIINLIRQNPFVTIQEMSQKINVATRTIIRDIEDLQSERIIIREGGRKKGRWVIKMIPY